MKTAVLFGSPHKKGSTAKLLTAFLNNLDTDAKIFNAYELDKSFCSGCDACAKTGSCVINDGMEYVLEALKQADVIVIAYPLYFDTVPAPLKVIIDRFQQLFNTSRQTPKTKKGIALITAGSGKARDYSADVMLRYVFDLLGAEFCGAYVLDHTDKGVSDEQISKLAKDARLSLG
ncbi:MAG: flavodoxin family protein [Bacillota bacterium]|nr:flavodoxin family protein [Bacillota bacterium]